MTNPWPEQPGPPQPGFPPPVGSMAQPPGTTPPRPPKKKRGGLIALGIIGALVVLALCCGGGIVGYVYWEEEQDIKLLFTTYDEISPAKGFTAGKAKEVDGIAMVKGIHSLDGWKAGDDINPVDETLAWFQKVSGGRSISESFLTTQCYGKNTGGCTENFKIDKQRVYVHFRATHTSSSISFFMEISVQPPISD